VTICLASSFFPRGIEYPPLVVAPPDSRTGGGADEGEQVIADRPLRRVTHTAFEVSTDFH